MKVLNSLDEFRITPPSMMTIQLNGREYQIPDDATVADVLRDMNATRHVAVEVNEQVVPRARHAETVLQPGDRVEFVTLVGGG